MSTISHQQKLEFADALKSYFKDKAEEAESKGEKLSQNLLAERMGISSGLVGYILKGQFDVLNNQKNLLLTDRIWKKVERFLGLDLKVWEMPNLDKCVNTFIESKLNAEQRIIDGHTGTGKSFSVEYFQRKYPTNTYVVTCSSDMNPKEFIYEVARAVGVNSKHISGTRYNVRKLAGEKLLSDSNNGPVGLIVDECENASPAILGALKDLYDHKKLFRYVGLTIIGSNDFVEKLIRWSERRVNYSLPQFLSRFTAEPVILKDYDAVLARKVCRSHNITDQESLDYIVRTATDYRLLDDLIHRYLSDDKLFKGRKAA